ncbi:hypothetical protein RRF57_013256 [Xylaria bambusicola]|uniref:Uncharacterized protein n=1 Tax=Xylaria bambusicola TaxID=326684 RepID=A0AAN7V1G2_9PEZI
MTAFFNPTGEDVPCVIDEDIDAAIGAQGEICDGSRDLSVRPCHIQAPCLGPKLGQRGQLAYVARRSNDNVASVEGSDSNGVTQT